MWKLLIVLAAVLSYTSIAFAQEAKKDKDGLYLIPPANTHKTVPTSPFEKPTMTLIEQETLSRNTVASQEVNRSLNAYWANYRKPITIVTWLTAAFATLSLAAKAAWVSIPFVSAVAAALERGFLRWPTTPLEWVNKLAIYIGLAEFALLFIRPG